MTKDNTEKSAIELLYYYKISDENGNIVYESPKEKSKSFIRAFAELLIVQMGHGTVSIRDVTNTMRSISPHNANFTVAVVAGSAGYGIVVGSGTTPVSTSDFNLVTLIPHGAGAGQLFYDVCIVTNVHVTATWFSFIINRNIRNDSGANITINEVGIRMQGVTGVGHPFLIVRDVVAPRVIIPNQTIHFSYELIFNL